MTSTRSAKAAALPKTDLDPTTFPELYGLSVVGSCMAPDIPNGRDVKVSKLDPYVAGDVVVVWMRPEFVEAGRTQAILKRIIVMSPPWVKAFPYKDHPKSDVLAVIFLGQDDRPDEMFHIRCSQILAIHKCVGLLPLKEAQL